MHDTPITKVIGVNKLGRNYKQYESRRRLIRQFDLFLADVRVFTMLPERLGLYFYTKKKIPGLLDLTEEPE
jgi:ribosome biogenesis protein UTP30